MSHRRRKRREERVLNSEYITESAPRGLSNPLPMTREVRVRPLFDKKTLDRYAFGLNPLSAEQLRDLRTIDNVRYVQDLRRLHIESDIRRNNIDPTGQKYVYRREYIGRDEKVLLPSDHPICKERAERRQILFAKKKAGKGGQKAPLLPKITVKCVRR